MNTEQPTNKTIMMYVSTFLVLINLVVLFLSVCLILFSSYFVYFGYNSTSARLFESKKKNEYKNE